MKDISEIYCMNEYIKWNQSQIKDIQSSDDFCQVRYMCLWKQYHSIAQEFVTQNTDFFVTSLNTRQAKWYSDVLNQYRPKSNNIVFQKNFTKGNIMKKKDLKTKFEA